MKGHATSCSFLVVSHVEFFHELPGYTEFFERLSAFARVIIFDKRGNGLSDRAIGAPSLEDRVDDIRAVMDAVGSDRATLFAVSEGGPLSLLFAGTNPTRVEAIVLYETFIRYGGVDDYPHGHSRDFHSGLTATWLELWGTGASLRFFGASLADDPRMRALWGRAERVSASPGEFRAIYDMLFDVDVRAAASSVRAPCLVLHGALSAFTDHAHYLAEYLPNARLVALEESIISLGLRVATGSWPKWRSS